MCHLVHLNPQTRKPNAFGGAQVLMLNDEGITDWTRESLHSAQTNDKAIASERAVARTGYSDFSRMDRALPEETRNYVPAVMRAMELLGSNKQGGLPLLQSGKSPAQSVLYASTESSD
jgi:hypothetical protein